MILTNHSSGLILLRIEFLKKLIQESYQVHISTPQDKNNEYVRKLTELGAIHHEIPIRRRNISLRKDMKLLSDYKKIIGKIQPDIILTYTIKPNIFGSYAANHFHVPVIMNITGIGTMLNDNYLKYFFKYMYKKACSKVNLVFFQNSTNFDFFIKNKLVDSKKAKLIPGSGVNLERFRPLEKTINDGMIRFLFIGRLMKEKGIDEFFDAAKNVLRKYPNTIFQIVGGTEEEKYISYSPENNNIELLGRSDDVRVQIREADCIVNPSYHEGMSNVLQEGAAMGKPLIASNIPGCREIVENGKNGFLFEVKNAEDLEDKLVRFIGLSEEEKISMGKYSRHKVETQFDRNIVVDEYMKAIKSIINA